MADLLNPGFVPADILDHPLTEAPVIPGWKRVATGKVREVFIPEESAGPNSAEKLLLVATDRISAFDHILDTPIPGKGAVLTQMSRWWFSQLSGVIDTHYRDENVPAVVAGRAMITRRLEMYPVECVARGYLTGSARTEYETTGMVCGIPLPPGLQEASRLSEAIFTPAIKAPQGQHDENVSADRIAQLHGRAVAKSLTDLTLLVYRKAAEIAAARGIILADTKFEFGAIPGRAIHGDTLEDAADAFILADEVITPDSSRFWPADQWREGRKTPSFDKQYVRDWLTSPDSGWSRHSSAPPPPLPAEIVAKTTERYLDAYRILTGSPLI